MPRRGFWKLPRPCGAKIFTGSAAASRNNSNDSGPPTTIAATESPLSSRHHRSHLIFRPSPPSQSERRLPRHSRRGMPGVKDSRAIPVVPASPTSFPRTREPREKQSTPLTPLRKAKGDASAASRGMPGDEEKRAIPQIIPTQRPQVIPASPTSFPRTREPREKQSTPLTPFAKQRGTRAQRAGGCPATRRSAQSPVNPAHAPQIIPASPRHSRGRGNPEKTKHAFFREATAGDARCRQDGDSHLATRRTNPNHHPLPLPRRLPNPNLTTLEILLLPNRHHLLQPVDEIQAPTQKPDVDAPH